MTEPIEACSCPFDVFFLAYLSRYGGNLSVVQQVDLQVFSNNLV